MAEDKRAGNGYSNWKTSVPCPPAMALAAAFYQERKKVYRHSAKSPSQTSQREPSITFKMGVGRRMKKQGLPDVLDEAHFTNLKRKAGMSVTESRAESQQYASTKKRRTSKAGKAESAPKEKGNRYEIFTNSMALSSGTSALKKSKRPEKVPLPQSDEDEGLDAGDLMDDEFDELSQADAEAGGLDDRRRLSRLWDPKSTTQTRIINTKPCFQKTKTTQVPKRN